MSQPYCFLSLYIAKNLDKIEVFRGCIYFMQPFWWGMVDSNHRRHCQQIYSLSPLATREIPQIYGYSIGAGGRIRTPDLLITNQLLYQLSYTSISPANRIIPELSLNVNKKVYQETENLSL